MHNDRRDPSQAVTDAPGKPKPPPRRQNPFNRPAPPPPLPPSDAAAAAGLRGGVVMSPMPFIPGYFGSSNAKAQQELQFLGKPSRMTSSAESLVSCLPKVFASGSTLHGANESENKQRTRYLHNIED